ncbi:unnamed protein product, partial [Iphiclides podalirius]
MPRAPRARQLLVCPLLRPRVNFIKNCADGSCNTPTVHSFSVMRTSALPPHTATMSKSRKMSEENYFQRHEALPERSLHNGNKPDKCYKKCIKRKSKCPSATETVSRAGLPCDCARLQSKESRLSKKRSHRTHKKRIRKAYKTRKRDAFIRWESARGVRAGARRRVTRVAPHSRPPAACLLSRCTRGKRVSCKAA